MSIFAGAADIYEFAERDIPGVWQRGSDGGWTQFNDYGESLKFLMYLRTRLEGDGICRDEQINILRRTICFIREKRPDFPMPDQIESIYDPSLKIEPNIQVEKWLDQIGQLKSRSRVIQTNDTRDQLYDSVSISCYRTPLYADQIR